MEEIEVKFLDIDVAEVQQKLKILGAMKKYDRVFRDRIFDFPGWPLDADSSWLRLRDKGDKITLSFKRRFGISEAGDAGMEETEIVVDDFERTSTLLLKLGMEIKFDEEKRRVHFELEEMEVDIDTWPLIPSYLEIEAKNWKQVREMADKLGLVWSERKQCAAMQVFEKYGVREKDYRILAFDKQVKRS